MYLKKNHTHSQRGFEARGITVKNLEKEEIKNRDI